MARYPKLKRMTCCGVREITELRSAESAQEAAFTLGKIMYDPPTRRDYGFVYQPPGDNRFRYAVFTQAQYRYWDSPAAPKKDYGKKLAAFIRANQLGTVVSPTAGVNPNTGNQVKLYVWTVDHDAFRVWYSAEKGRRDGTSSANS